MMVIRPEVFNHHLFNNGEVKAIFSKMCHRKNLLTSVGCFQGIIFQPSRCYYFGHSTLSLSKYGKGVDEFVTILSIARQMDRAICLVRRGFDLWSREPRWIETKSKDKRSFTLVAAVTSTVQRTRRVRKRV